MLHLSLVDVKSVSRDPPHPGPHLCVHGHVRKHMGRLRFTRCFKASQTDFLILGGTLEPGDVSADRERWHVFSLWVWGPSFQLALTECAVDWTEEIRRAFIIYSVCL